MPVKSVKVDLFRDEIKVVLHDLASKEVLKTTLKVLNRARVLTPVDTGNLRAAHQFRMRKPSPDREVGEVFNKVKYALPVHEGRRALTIRPKKKRALSFVWHGQPMVRKSVFQPARKGKPWMRDALREVAAQQGYKMQEVITGSGGDS